METLPLEIVAQVASYLSVKDLAASCAVSVWWRDVFGCDQVWRRRCDIKIAEHLETTSCRVEPKFSSPQSEDSSLSPIGHWRLAFMRETHLWRNWIHGNYKTEKNGLKRNDVILFLNSNLVMVLSKNIFKLKDTSVKSTGFVARLKVYLSAYEKYTATVVKSDTVVSVSNGNIVKVIEVDTETLTMSVKHSFCIDDSLSGKSHYIDHLVANTVFLGFENKNIYIWDLVSGTKLKTERLFYDDTLKLIQPKHCEDVLVVGNTDYIRYHYLVYNTKKLKFRPLVLASNFPSQCLIIKGYVATAFGVRLRVYNYKTSKLVYDVPMTEVLNSDVHVLQDGFMYMNNKCALQQFIPRRGSSRCIMDTTAAVPKPIGEKLLLVTTRDNKNEIWRMGPASTVKTSVPYMGHMEINDTFSKVLLLRSRGSFLHFW